MNSPFHQRTFWNRFVADFAAAPPDTTNPVLTSAAAAEDGHDAYTGSVNVSEPCRVWHVYSASSTPLSIPAVKAGVNAWVVVAGPYNVSGSGLSAAATGYLHFYAEDGAGNPSTVVVSNAFTTDEAPDVTGPTLSSPTGAEDGHDAYTGSVSTNETGTLWHVKTPTATPADAATIKAGISQAMGSTGIQNVSGSADASSTYYLQFYAEDALGNPSNIVVSSAFTTDEAPTAPSIAAAPTISGTETEGETLTATLASVTGNPTPVSTVQWKRAGELIDDADELTYTLVTADAGNTLTVVHSATNVAGSDSAESDPTGTIAALPTDNPPVVDVTYDDIAKAFDFAITEAGLPGTLFVDIRGDDSATEGSTLAGTGGDYNDSDTINSLPYTYDQPLTGVTEGANVFSYVVREASLLTTFGQININIVLPATLSAGVDNADGADASTGSVDTDKDDGTIYLVHYTGADPSAAQVIAGTDATDSAAPWADTITVSTTGTQAFAGSGLSSSTTYKTAAVHVRSGVASDVLIFDGFTTTSGNTAPVITGLPTFSGTETEGQSVTLIAASVTGTPTPTRTWQMKRSGTLIGTVTSPYTFVAADVGETLTFVQNESNVAGSDSAESAATGTIAAASSGNTADVGFDNASAWVTDSGFSVTGSELVVNGTQNAFDWAYMASGSMEAVTSGGTVSINLNVASRTGTPGVNCILYFYAGNDEESAFIDSDTTGIFTLNNTGLQTAVTGISVPVGANFMQVAIRSEEASSVWSLSEIVIS